jgi:CubicO group peptidase (beta-lactamase class C family)
VARCLGLPEAVAMSDDRTAAAGPIAGADALVCEFLREQALAGLAIGIVQGGVVRYSRCFGIADSVGRGPVTPGTVFRIGSVSKTFTAIGLLQLWEQRLFDLDDPVNDHLRAFRLAPRETWYPPTTIKHLLTHTGGIGELRRLSDLLRPVTGLAMPLGSRPPPLRDYYKPALEVREAPGVSWAYSNHGFAVLGQLIEELSGEPFSVHMRGHVFDPLGMTSTDYDRSARVVDRLATGYTRQRRGLRSVKDLEIVPQPAGSVFSVLPDMTAYLLALTGGGANNHGRILRQSTIELMMSPHYEIDPRLPGMGLGFLLDRFSGHRIAAHTGSWPGFACSLLVAPDDRSGIVVLANTSGRQLYELAGELLRHVLGLAKTDIRTDLPERPDLWDELCGYYSLGPGFLNHFRSWGLTLGGVEVAVASTGHLTVRALSSSSSLRRGLRLYPDDPEDPLRFQVALPDVGSVPLVFSRDDEGRVSALHLSRQVLATLHKHPSPRNPSTWLRLLRPTASRQ